MRPPALKPRVAPLGYRNAERFLPAPGGLGGLRTPSVDAMGARPIAGAPPILLKNSSQDRKSTRLNSSHLYISYAVFCLKKKKFNISVRLPCDTSLRTLLPPQMFLYA